MSVLEKLTGWLHGSHLIGFVLAVGLAFAAMGIQHWIEPLTPQTPYQLFLVAVALSALTGGVAEGLVTLAVSVAGRLYLFSGLRLAVLVQHPSIGFRLLLFIVLGSVTAWLVGRLRRAQNQLASALGGIADGVAITNRKGEVVYLNPVAELLSGWKRTDAIGTGIRTVLPLHEEDSGKPAPVPLPGEISIGEPVRIDTPVILAARNGPAHIVEGRVSAIHDSHRALQGAIVVFRDVSEQRELARQLLKARKMEALGRMASGVAHDFNNILTVITGHAEFVRALPAHSGDAGFRESLDSILKATEDAGRLTQQLLVFSRRQPARRKIVDLNELVGRLERPLRTMLDARIDLALELAPGLWRAKADPNQLEQVILNLATNGRDAMPDGGRLTIRTRNVDSEAETNNELEPGAYVALDVSDTGCGMDESTRSHIFEPFFTTKAAGKGTGLGLAMVYGIVEQHSGAIRVASQPGQGSTFTVLLHRTEEAGSLAPPALPGPPRTRTAACILVAEDHDCLGRLIARALTKAGHEVWLARDGTQALVIGAREIGRLDLVVTDVMLPALSGPELIEGLRILRRDLKCLFISGNARDAAGGLDRATPNTRFLPKPFRMACLVDEVAVCLADSFSEVEFKSPGLQAA